jgi:hypothetical protein
MPGKLCTSNPSRNIRLSGTLIILKKDIIIFSAPHKAKTVRFRTSTLILLNSDMLSGSEV